MSLKISTALRDAEEKPAIAGSENREGISVYWTPTSGLIQAIYTRLISFNPPNNPRRQRLQLFPFNRSRDRSWAQGQDSPRSCGEQGKVSSLSSSNQAPSLGRSAASQIKTRQHCSNPRSLGTHWALVIKTESQHALVLRAVSVQAMEKRLE